MVLEDLLKDISEAVEDDSSRHDAKEGRGTTHISVGDIVNNQGTVVIGGNVNQGRREEDKPGSDDGSHGRRATDRETRRELLALRDQVQRLKRLVVALYARCALNGSETPHTHCRTCLTLSRPKRPVAPKQAKCRNSSHATLSARRAPRKPAPLRLSAHHSAPQPTKTHSFPYLVSPLIEWQDDTGDSARHEATVSVG